MKWAFGWSPRRPLESAARRVYLARMGLVTTPAIILHAFPYSETSKIVRIATRDVGVQSAIAKGARRPRSAFGASLSLFSEGEAQLYVRENRSLQTLAGFDVQHQREALAHDLARFAAASALVEVVFRCGPGSPAVSIYEDLRGALDELVTCRPPEVPGASLRGLWRLVDTFGFAPTLDVCARDGAEIDHNGQAAFSVADGGVLCRLCSTGVGGRALRGSDVADLRSLIDVHQALPELDRRHAAAHRRLVADFVRTHLSEGSSLEALKFWELGRWDVTSS